MLANRIVLPLADRGAVRLVIFARETANGIFQDALDETIEYMDAYYLGKEDWDAIVELGVDNMKEELILKKIPTATKSAFTRQFVVSIHMRNQKLINATGITRWIILLHSIKVICSQPRSERLQTLVLHLITRTYSR
jgi:hypothetical protein